MMMPGAGTDLMGLFGRGAPMPGTAPMPSLLADLVARAPRFSGAASFPRLDLSSSTQPRQGQNQSLAPLLQALGKPGNSSKQQSALNSMLATLFGQGSGPGGVMPGGFSQVTDQDIPDLDTRGEFGLDSGVSNLGFDSLPDFGGWT